MKIKSLFIFLAAASLLSVQSCLKEQADIFDKPSSTRLEEFVQNVQKTLTSSASGWVMEYYPGIGQSYGGYAYHLLFTENGEVTAISELDPEESYTSYYTMTKDNGPVLSFDTYNEVLHYFATPSSSEYEAKGGDFEFTVLSCDPEAIVMLGKRSGNRYTLRPFAVGGEPKAYIKKVLEMSESLMAASVKGNIGTLEVLGDVNLDSRCVKFAYEKTEAGDSTLFMPFMFTPEGIRAYKPVTLGGVTFQDLKYDEDANTLTAQDVKLQGLVPEDYTKFDEFVGSYKLTFNRTANVTFTPYEDRTGFTMTGLSPVPSVRLAFDKAKGRVKWYTQVVGADGNNSIYLCAWSLDKQGGSLTWSTDSGVVIYRNVEKDGEFLFEDNGEYEEGFGTDSFILWSITPSGTSAGQFTGWGTSQFPYLKTLTKL